jgi:predicted transcriptional regulator
MITKEVFSVSITKELAAKVRRKAASLNRTVSAVASEALTAHLKRKAPKNQRRKGDAV